MTTREAIAWALAAALAVILAFAWVRIDGQVDIIDFEAERAAACEDDQKQCLETLDLCSRVVTELAAQCGEP